MLEPRHSFTATLTVAFLFFIGPTTASGYDCGQCADAARFGCEAKSFTSSEAKCRKTISKNVGKVQKTAAKVSAGCHKDRNNDKRDVGDDCNDMTVADSKKKLEKAQDKFVSAMAKSCPGTLGDGVLDEYISCTASCNAQLAIGNPITTYEDLASCLACVAAEEVAARNASVLGNPTAPLESKEAQKCHQQLGKSYDKYLQTIVKNRAKCQDTAEAKEGACGLTSTTCATDDPKDKIAGALSKAAAGVDGKCAGVDFSAFNLAGPCAGVVDAAGYNACATPETDATGETTLVATYELPDQGVCPIRVERTLRGGFGVTCASNADCAPVQVCAPAGPVNRCQTATRMDLGWTGEAHGLDPNDDFTVSTDLACPQEGRCSDAPLTSCDTNADCVAECIQADPCGSCTVEGISPLGPESQASTRCAVDTAILCDEPFGPDIDCGTVCSASAPGSCSTDADCGANGGFCSDTACRGGDTCATNADCTNPGGVCEGRYCGYYFGPPQPRHVGNNSLCALLRVESDLTGTVNPDDGTSELGVDLRSMVHNGIGTLLPCPVCVGDATAGDGVRGGVCDYGSELDPDPHNGQPCDAQGFHGTFANADDDVGLSLDCPPSIGKNITGGGLRVGMDFTTGTSSLPFETNCDTPFPPPPASVCACGMCSLDPTKACANNADCDLATEGTCTTNGGGQAAPRAPNRCSDLTCTPVGGGRGECTDEGLGDVLMSCDGQLRGSGEGYLTCGSNDDCALLDDICGGGDCGECTLTRNRPCFLDPIEFTGSPDADDPMLAATFCLPPTSNNSFNVTFGSPGPGRMRVQSAVRSVFK